jgi:S-adenosylmethionine/arginine decarboxylase-like enzyme
MVQKFWGKSAVINLYECNDYIRNSKRIREFIEKLCRKINMKRHGPLYLDEFGKGNLKGYSCMQFIETSSITAHFDDKKGKSNRAFIDIFSCRDFDEKTAVKFCKDFFGAKKAKLKTIIRD